MCYPCRNLAGGPTPQQLPDYLLARGRHAFTLDEATELLRRADRRSTVAALSWLKKRGEIFSPSPGYYVVIPPEYKLWGAPPADWFVDGLMRLLKRPYYIALLSAAASHGASHQAPQVFQVMTDDASRVRDRKYGRSRIRFYSNRWIDVDPVEQITVPTGYINLSTKETTIVDLVTQQRAAGGVSNIATILREIGQLNGAELARIASRRGRPIVRRVGWLVSNFGAVDDIEALRQAARPDEGQPNLLTRSAPRRGRTDPQWALLINTPVEPDV